jgi:hypothetical protein
MFCEVVERADPPRSSTALRVLTLSRVKQGACGLPGDPALEGQES